MAGRPLNPCLRPPLNRKNGTWPSTFPATFLSRSLSTSLSTSLSRSPGPPPGRRPLMRPPRQASRSTPCAGAVTSGDARVRLARRSRPLMRRRARRERIPFAPVHHLSHTLAL